MMAMIGKLMVWLIRAYKCTLSPLLGNCCRFHPSCSSYSIEGIQKHGALRGAWLGVRRLFRCHPFHAGGVDFVPSSWDGRCESGRR